MPPRAAQVQRRAADAIPPASGQAEIRPTRPRADRPRSGCAGEPAASPGNRVSPPPFPACATSQLPAARRTSAQHSPDARPPGSGPTSAHIRDARPRPDLCPPAADVRVLPASRRRTDDNAEKLSADAPHNMPHPSLPRYPPSARFRTLTFPAGRSSDASAQTAEPPRTPFRSDLHSGAFRRLQFSARPRSSRAQLPPCFRSPRGFRLLPRAPRAPCSPRSIPRAFSCAFPALLPHSVPLFCASFVKKHYKVSTRCAKPLQRRASSRSALRPAPQQHRNVSRRSQVANIKQLLRFRRDCDHAFIAVRSPFPIPRCRARQRFFRIFSSRNPLL